jgi:hypothetical protein
MMANAAPNNIAVETAPRHKTADASLASIENRITSLLLRTTDEAVLSGLSRVLQDLMSLRVSMERPAEGNKRSAPRFRENAVVKLIRKDGSELYAGIVDISTGGAMLEADVDLTADEEFEIVLPGLAERVSALVLSSRNGFIRVVFNKLPTHMIIAFTKHIDRHFTRF